MRALSPCLQSGFMFTIAVYPVYPQTSQNSFLLGPYTKSSFASLPLDLKFTTLEGDGKVHFMMEGVEITGPEESEQCAVYLQGRVGVHVCMGPLQTLLTTSNRPAVLNLWVMTPVGVVR